MRVRGLRRSYGQGPSAYEAVRGVYLDVPAGSITALLGTNGAGKTSTLEVIEGLAPATDGAVSVLGLDPIADRAVLRRRTGVLLQRSGFSGDLTVHEHGRTTLETDALQRSLSDLMAWAAHNQVALDDLDARSPSLERVFLSIADGPDPADSATQGTPAHAEGSLR